MEINPNYQMLFWATIACISVLILTPVAYMAAWKFNWLDRPTQRKNHAKTTAYLGGVSLFLIFTFVMGSLFLDAGKASNYLFGWVGVSLMFVVGVIDDKYPIHAVQKLLYQIVTVCLLLLSVGEFSVLEFCIAFPIGILFINSFNLIDGRDGEALGIAAFHCLPLSIIATQQGNGALQIVILALAFGFVGLLPFNIHPAKIFLGDGGSLSIGAILFFLYVQLFLGGDGEGNYFAWLPVLLTLPLIDTFSVMLFRWRNGKPIMKPDHNHLHHLITKLGFSHGKVVSIIHSIALASILPWMAMIHFEWELYWFLILLPLWVLFYKKIHQLSTRGLT